MKALIILALALVAQSAFCDDLPPEVKALIKKRDDQIAATNKAFVAELEKLKISYTKRGDLETALSIVELINEVPEPRDKLIVGNWTFSYKGKKRVFKFSVEHTFSGQYAVSGRNYTGSWRWNDSNVILVRKGESKDFANITLDKNSNANFKSLESGSKMEGRKESSK